MTPPEKKIPPTKASPPPTQADDPVPGEPSRVGSFAADAIDEITKTKKEFTEDDVAARAARVLEKCVSHGTTHMRTHLEVDLGIGMRGFDGVFPLIEQ